MGSLTPDHIWGETLNILRLQTTKDTYAAVLQKTRLVAANGRYTIETPTEFVKTWLENRFTLPISRALGTVLDQPLDPDLLTFVVRDYMEPIDYSPEGDTVEDEGDGFYVCYREFILRGYARKFGPHVGMTYHGICCYRNMTTNEGWPFQKTLAYVVGISNRKIVDCIKTLSEYNLIKVATRPRKGGGVANRYIVVGPAKWRPLD